MIYEVIGIGAWQTVYAVLYEFFTDITNWISLNNNSKFSQTNISLSHLIQCNIRLTLGTAGINPKLICPKTFAVSPQPNNAKQNLIKLGRLIQETFVF